MTIVDGLCEVCRQTLSNWEEVVGRCEDEDGYECAHHLSVFELNRSGNMGCLLCALFISDMICDIGEVPSNKFSDIDNAGSVEA